MVQFVHLMNSVDKRREKGKRILVRKKGPENPGPEKIS
tara:strand:+ start:8472 stop:8585 length:114 start_codon:yes stop_codon:yes gene_type:complete